MGITVRQFVESLTTHGVLTAGELSAVRDAAASLEAEADADALARKLVDQGKLTRFQAANLYQGRGKALVFGEYVVLDKLGAGGMGQVYKAQHRRMKRVVALKVLPPGVVNTSPKSLERFYQEVEVAAKLTHPNIVTAYDAGEAHGLHFLVMEYVDGMDLSSHIAKQGPLELQQALNVVLQAARGLGYAHSLGIIHRDIKPGNLLVDRAGNVKILDMGLARIDHPLADASTADHELTATGEVMGTIDYMSPEQAQDTRATDHRADIYALGCTLHRLLTGRVPYPGDTAIKKILAHRDLPIPSLRAVRPDVPDVVDRLFQKMVAKSAADRVQTMTQVVGTLEKLLSGTEDEQSSVVIGAVEAIDDDSAADLFEPLPPASLPAGSSAVGKRVSATMIEGAAMPAAVAKQAPPGKHSAKVVAKAAGTASDSGAHPADGSYVAPRRRDRTPLIVVGVAASAVVGAVIFFLTRTKPEPSPGDAIAAAATGTGTGTVQPPAAAQFAMTEPTASPTPTVVAPKFPEPATTETGSFFGVTSPPSAAMTSSTVTPGATPTAPVAVAMTTAVPAPTSLPPTPTPSSTATRPPPAPPLAAEIDLLSRVDPAQNPILGRWTREDKFLLAQEPQSFAAASAIALPREYDVTLTADALTVGSVIGFGLVLEDRQPTFFCESYRGGFDSFDGFNWLDPNNLTARYGTCFVKDEPVRIVCAVRENGLYVRVNDRQLVYAPREPHRFSKHASMPAFAPDQMFLAAIGLVRFTRWTIGPPATVTSPPSSVNLAAAYDSTKHVAEGEFSRRRNEILVNLLPGRYSRLSFDLPRQEDYEVTTVVERLAGDSYFAIGLPLRLRRVGVVVDWGADRYVGLQYVGTGGPDLNPTGRKTGMLLTPGRVHVVKASVSSDPKGRRIRASVDGRQWVDYVATEVFEGVETSVPETAALSIGGYAGNWRILRLDVTPLDAKRLPVPSADDKLRAMGAIRGLSSPALVKGASADAKLTAVDQLRREAAAEVDDAAVRYVALEEALRIAIEAGDLPSVCDAVVELASTFDIDPRTVQQRSLDVFKAPRPQTPAGRKEFVDQGLEACDRAAGSEQFDWSFDLATAVDRAIGTSNPEAKRELKARLLEYAWAKQLQTPAREAEPLLADDPNAAAARTTRGKYRCFAVGDWSGGLKDLTAGDDAELKALAELELGDTKTPDAQAALAEAWWTAFEKHKDVPWRWALLERSAEWHRRALPSATGRTKAASDRRKTLIAQQRKASGGAGGPRRPLDAVKIGDRWYKYYPMNLPWPAAVETCARLGGSLLTIETPTENQAVAELVLRSAKVERASCWLGISDEASEGKFVNLEGVPIVPPAYFNWVAGQPDNSLGTEDAVLMDVIFQADTLTGQWADTIATTPLPFVCEWDR